MSMLRCTELIPEFKNAERFSIILNLFPGLRKRERVGLGSHVHTFFQKSWETMHVTPVHLLPQCILVQIGDGVQL